MGGALKLYPRLFQLQRSGAKIRVLPAPAPAPVARPVQVGGSSGSAAPEEPRERQARIVEVPDSRAPYRRFPNDQRIYYKVGNPARAGSVRHARFEAYKTATTIGEARRLGGATSQDISMDIAAGKFLLL